MAQARLTPRSLRIALYAALAAAPLGHASAATQSLVLGSGGYTSLPPLPSCVTSAHAVAAALRRSGAEVVEQTDGGIGAVDAALGRFARAVSAGPGQPAVIYACGYVADLGGRAFLLPSSVNLARPEDMLSQGILAKSLFETLGHGSPDTALIAVDAVPAPGAAPDAGLGALAGYPFSPGTGLVAVARPAGSQPLTPLASAMIAALNARNARTDTLLQAVRSQLGAVAAFHVPAAPGALLAAEPAIPPPAATSAPPPPSAHEQAAATLRQPANLPDEAAMTAAQRQQVQAALARLGYYDASQDGIFGPETRAAIRRWQHEIHAPMTGHLSAAEANRLVGG